ncbi:MAG: hypothetical protein ACRDE2_06875, partial [Chitinophagaceae bacterium]
MLKKIYTGFSCLFFIFFVQNIYAQSVQTSVQEKKGIKIFSLSNDEVTQQVFIKNDMLAGDLLQGQSTWLAKYNNADDGVATDGNFTLKMMWTDWSAPGRQVNANVAIAFTKKDYQYQTYQFVDVQGGGKELVLFFTPFNAQNTIQLKLTYQLLPGKFYSRRQVSVRDTISGANWLDEFISRNGMVSASNGVNEGNTLEVRGLGSSNYSVMETENESRLSNGRIIKPGAFGQPCALDFAHGGVFFGVEYPAATTSVKEKEGHFHLECQEIIGTVVKSDWVNSKWIVEGLAPDHHVREWFFNYLPDIKYTPDRPYALYNSWYDLRSPAFKDVA